MSKGKIRWGVLGTGRIIGKAGAGIAMSDNGIWHGIAGRNEVSGRRAAEAYGLEQRYKDYQDLIDDPEIDAVYIALLNHLHKEWAVKACEAGKHVLLEKPFALSLAEAQAIADAAKRSSVQVQEAMVWRHQPWYEAIRGMVREGAIGDWVRFRGHFSAVLPKESTRWAAAWGGGALYDLGCYPLAWARYYAEEEPSWADAELVLNPEYQVDSRAVATLYFPSGRTAHFDVALDMPHGSSFELIGTKGMLTVTGTVTLTEASVGCRVGDQEYTWKTDRITPFRLQAERFAEAILEDRKLAYGIDEALKQCRAMDALFASAKHGSRVLV